MANYKIVIFIKGQKDGQRAKWTKNLGTVDRKALNDEQKAIVAAMFDFGDRPELFDAGKAKKSKGAVHISMGYQVFEDGDPFNRVERSGPHHKGDPFDYDVDRINAVATHLGYTRA